MTSLTDMPADIVEAARSIVKKIREEGWEGAGVVVGLSEAILAERQRDQWQDIATAPKDGTEILVCLTHNISADEWVTLQWVDSQIPGARWPVCESRIDIPFLPTMWRPLPAPPKYEDD
ncbi:hypothetical protein GAO09_19485 [Rhizobiales bacterium RZME27]|uniref:DUF551 domain-containing protein n=1 Tax=Endobacterium cereale TaxID=2663029 RepID=A0A6A8AEM8_9HYPH|nr:hypothetical protein [Endobacterium cereale]MQY48220.1 hypothetical protein [Endobacterium cereale]